MNLFPEIEAPIPEDEESCIKELEYLQKEIILWNNRQANPRAPHNCKVMEYTDFDSLLTSIIDARKTVIQMRIRWADYTFKYGKPDGDWL